MAARRCETDDCTNPARPGRTICNRCRTRLHHHGNVHHNEWTLADEDEVALVAERHSSARQLTRREQYLVGLSLTDGGVSAAQISEILSVTPRTVHRWRSRRRQEGRLRPAPPPAPDHIPSHLRYTYASFRPVDSTAAPGHCARPAPSLTAAQAVALSLLQDGYRQRTITQRTGVSADELYQLAAQHGITAPHGTVEGYGCHEARGDTPCWKCTLADGQAHARDRAQHRKKPGALPRPALHPRRKRPTPA